MKAVEGTGGETPWTVCGITRASRHQRGHRKVNSIPRKPRLPVPQFPRLKTRRRGSRPGPRLARWSPGDAPRSRGGCARPLEAAAGGAGPGARSKPVRLPVCAAEPPRLRGGRDGHIFHGYAIPRLGVYSEHVHTHGESGTELMRARLFIYP